MKRKTVDHSIQQTLKGLNNHLQVFIKTAMRPCELFVVFFSWSLTFWISFLKMEYHDLASRCPHFAYFSITTFILNLTWPSCWFISYNGIFSFECNRSACQRFVGPWLTWGSVSMASCQPLPHWARLKMTWVWTTSKRPAVLNSVTL